MRTIDDQIRASIQRAEKRGITRYAIAKVSGLPQSQLTRFMQGADVRVSTLESIARAMGKKITLK